MIFDDLEDIHMEDVYDYKTDPVDIDTDTDSDIEHVDPMMYEGYNVEE